MAEKHAVQQDECPCGGGHFASCCGPYLAQTRLPPTPEALMRSRYSAFVRGDEVYLRASWHPDTCPTGPLLDADPGLKWLGLMVKGSTMQGDTGTVEFVARYKIQGRAHRLHEVSQFVRENGRWWYRDGQFPEPAGKGNIMKQNQ